ncbi:prothoracicostatic peptides [Hyalella azteca]|uniref:Prothoracicostatic peptides n=1 Tax=Hyalella azteca TaxID=294128 RepID=A0A8B7PFZ6_HYAAZ|nr:prothoracicostatic peptides [Hyalella azteca]
MGWVRIRENISIVRFMVILSLVWTSLASEQSIHKSTNNFGPANQSFLSRVTSEKSAVADGGELNVYGTSSEDHVAQEAEGEPNLLIDDELRTKRDGEKWSSLRGSWGKRNPAQLDRGWNNFRGTWGKKADWSSLRGSWGKRGSDAMADKRADWSNFRGSWGKRTSAPEASLDDSVSDLDQFDHDYDAFNEDPSSALSPDDATRLNNDALFLETVKLLSQRAQNKEDFADQEILNSGDDEEQNLVQKRSTAAYSGWLKRPVGTLLLAPRSVNWSSLRGSWGKRSGPTNWSSLRGTWGKRPAKDSNWAGLRGTWGKRPAKDSNWADLRGTWGKRPAKDSNWANLRGTWGKRPAKDSNWANLRGTWGKRPAKDSNWADLRGTWGKKSGGQKWSSLRGTWGKRSDQVDELDLGDE